MVLMAVNLLKTNNLLHIFYKWLCFLEPRVKHLWFMGSIWPVTIVVISYLYFVLKIGPELMRFRNPINIDRIVMVYNAVQVVFSLYLVKEVRRLI